MALRPDQIADLVTTTLKDFPKDAWTDISLDLQEYVAMSRLLQEHKVGFGGGNMLEWQVRVQNSGAASNTGLYDTDDVSVVDQMKTATVPWSYQKTYFSYDEREDALQQGWHRIVSLIKVRRLGALNDLAELLEENFWNRPSDTTTQAELLKPYGLPYWIVGENAVLNDGGFNGGAPHGHSSGAGGLSSSTYGNWANWNSMYTVISKTDLVREMREAATKCKFMAPHPYPDTGTAPRYAIYTNYNVISSMEEILESQNDNLGNDVASKDGRTVFRGTPLMWAPYLDANTLTENTTVITDPIYGIDWGSFKCVFKTGEFMRESPPTQSPTQHRVRNVFIDTMQQFRCTDRRRQWVIYKTA